MRVFSTLCALGMLVILTGCGKASQENITFDGKPTTVLEGSGFSMATPLEWTSSGTIDRLPPPARGQVVLASVAQKAKYGFSNNLIVLKDSLSTLMSSRQYSVLNNTHTIKKYLEYKEVKAESIIFKKGSDTSRLYVFDAKYNNQTPRMRFIQSAKVCGTDVYIVHFSIALDRDPEDYINLTKTFNCK